MKDTCLLFVTTSPQHNTLTVITIQLDTVKGEVFCYQKQYLERGISPRNLTANPFRI